MSGTHSVNVSFVSVRGFVCYATPSQLNQFDWLFYIVRYTHRMQYMVLKNFQFGLLVLEKKGINNKIMYYLFPLQFVSIR